jgi:seryl-tRNA synthetase
MTEKDFLRQIWRPHDTITTADNVPGKVLGVSFTTKSVRAFISGAPEWVRCELIESHSTARGGDADEVALIDELQTKLSFANQRVELLQEHVKEQEEKLSRNYAGDLLKNVNIILNTAAEKKKRIEKLENCMQQILDTLEKMGVDTEQVVATE